MNRLPLVVALLVLCLLPGVADAKYRIPQTHEVLAGSSVILVGEVKSVGERSYVVKVSEQVAGPKQAISGEITVWRRKRSGRCVPQDPAGVEPGTRWIWVLEATGKPKSYRSWVSTPIGITKTGRVAYGRALPKGAKQLPLADFVALIKAYRRCFKVDGKGKATVRVSAAELKAFEQSSANAAELVRQTPHKAR